MRDCWALLLLLAVLAVGAEAKREQGESAIYAGIKIGFWWLLGVTLGVYFQARLNLKERMRGIIEVVLYGLFVGVTVYTLFFVGELVKEYY